MQKIGRILGMNIYINIEEIMKESKDTINMIDKALETNEKQPQKSTDSFDASILDSWGVM